MRTLKSNKSERVILSQSLAYLDHAVVSLTNTWLGNKDYALSTDKLQDLLKAHRYLRTVLLIQISSPTEKQKLRFNATLQELAESPGGFQLLTRHDLVLDSDDLEDSFGPIMSYYIRVIIGFNLLTRKCSKQIRKNVQRDKIQTAMEALKSYGKFFEDEVIAYHILPEEEVCITKKSKRRKRMKKKI